MNLDGVARVERGGKEVRACFHSVGGRSSILERTDEAIQAGSRDAKSVVRDVPA